MEISGRRFPEAHHGGQWGLAYSWPLARFRVAGGADEVYRLLSDGLPGPSASVGPFPGKEGGLEPICIHGSFRPFLETGNDLRGSVAA